MAQQTVERRATANRLPSMSYFAFLANFKFGAVFAVPFEMRARLEWPGREPDALVLLDPHLDPVMRPGADGPADFAVELGPIYILAAVSRRRLRDRGQSASARIRGPRFRAERLAEWRPELFRKQTLFSAENATTDGVVELREYPAAGVPENLIERSQKGRSRLRLCRLVEIQRSLSHAVAVCRSN